MEMNHTITGLSDVLDTFRKLPVSTQNKAMRPALRKGGAVIRDRASENISSQVSDEATGLAARNVRVYSLRKYQGNLRVGVMIKRGLVTSKGVRVGLYMSVFEYGKLNQFPKSWARRAAREGTSEAFNAIADEAAKRMPLAVEDARK